jgi:hypothetical protein
MRRMAIWTLALALLGAMTTAALAASPQFKRKPALTYTDLGTTLRVSGALTGLGNEDLVITLSATGDPTTTCANPQRHLSPGQNPGEVTVTGGEAVPADEIKNGNLSFSVFTAQPPQPTFEEAGCPNAQWTATITDIDFTSADLDIYQGPGCLDNDGNVIEANLGTASCPRILGDDNSTL